MLVTANIEMKDITKWLQDIVHNVWEIVKKKQSEKALHKALVKAFNQKPEVAKI